MTPKTTQFTPSNKELHHQRTPLQKAAHAVPMLYAEAFAGSNNKEFIMELYNDAALLETAAPAMYEALTNLLPEEDIVSTDNGPDECRWCGRTYPDNDNEGELQVLCTSDDCPGYMARQAIAQAEGQ